MSPEERQAADLNVADLSSRLSEKQWILSNFSSALPALSTDKHRTRAIKEDGKSVF